MMNLQLHAFNLKMRDTFRISREVRDVQEALIVELQATDAQGSSISGLGETTANPYYHFDIESMKAELEKLREKIEQYTITAEASGEHAGTPEDFWQYMYPHLKNSSFTLCALDMAAHDLFGKKTGQPLYKLWGLDPKDSPVSNYTIGIDTIENMVHKMKSYPWPLYKIKLGTTEDLDIVRELRKHTNAVFRVDANCAWGVDETISNARELKKLGVEFIEQPLRADDMEGMEQVYQASVLPLMADESCIGEEDVQKCHKRFHGINIKLTKCGGITPAQRMIQQAKQLNMKVMVGCMTESTVGISAIAHLSPMLDYVDMDGALLLAEDIATGVTVKKDGVDFGVLNGTGAQLKSPEVLQSMQYKA